MTFKVVLENALRVFSVDRPIISMHVTKASAKVPENSSEKVHIASRYVHK